MRGTAVVAKEVERIQDAGRGEAEKRQRAFPYTNCQLSATATARSAARGCEGRLRTDPYSHS